MHLSRLSSLQLRVHSASDVTTPNGEPFGTWTDKTPPFPLIIRFVLLALHKHTHVGPLSQPLWWRYNHPLSVLHPSWWLSSSTVSQIHVKLTVPSQASGQSQWLVCRQRTHNPSLCLANNCRVALGLVVWLDVSYINCNYFRIFILNCGCSVTGNSTVRQMLFGQRSWLFWNFIWSF